MADLTITAANVVAGSNATTERGTAGETITAGQVVYKSTSTGKFMLAETDSATGAARRPIGVALNSASLNQPLVIAKSGDVTIGATLTAGTAYYLSGTAGGICPVDDLTGGDDVVLIGLAKSTSVLAIDIQSPGVTL